MTIGNVHIGPIGLLFLLFVAAMAAGITVVVKRSNKATRELQAMARNHYAQVPQPPYQQPQQPFTPPASQQPPTPGMPS